MGLIREKIIKLIIVTVLPVLLAGGVILVWYAGRLKPKVHNLDEYVCAGETDFSYGFEGVTQDPEHRTVALGWLVDSDGPYDFYNYATDGRSKGVYNYMHLGVVVGDRVIEFPTKLRDRTDIDMQYEDAWQGHCGFMAYIPAEYMDEELVILARKYQGDSYIIKLGVSANEYASKEV